MKKHTSGELAAVALTIATAIANVDTDQRGDLLKMAGEMLRNKGQDFTGNILVLAGRTYNNEA